MAKQAAAPDTAEAPEKEETVDTPLIDASMAAIKPFLGAMRGFFMVLSVSPVRLRCSCRPVPTRALPPG